MLAEEALLVLLRAIQDHADVGVTRLPRIGEERSGALFPDGSQRVPQSVERFAKWRAPGLVPLRMRSALAATVGAPALDTVRAAPRRLLADPGLVDGRKPLQELAVVRDARHPRQI